MKRLLSFIMVVVMLFSVTPLQEVHAEVQNETGVESSVTEYSEEESAMGQESTALEKGMPDTEEESALENSSTELDTEGEETDSENPGTEQMEEEKKESDSTEETKETEEDDWEEIRADEGAEQDGQNQEAEEALSNALKAVEDGKALRLTAEEWIAAGGTNVGDLVWTTANIAENVSVTPVDVIGQSFDKAVKIKTKQKVTSPWDAQAFFRMEQLKKTIHYSLRSE